MKAKAVTNDRPSPRQKPVSRRQLVTGVGALACTVISRAPVLAQAAPAEPSALFIEALAELSRGREIKPGRIVLDIPRLAESGNSVQVRFVVESPMTAADHVKTVHLLSEQNPIATIARFRFSPASARGEVETYVRLATTQNVHAIAEMSDGSLWGTKAEVVVLLAACLDGG